MPSVEDLKERYRKTETEIDGFGRAITVGRIRPADKRHVLELTESTSPFVLVSMLRLAAVRKVVSADGSETAFAVPRTRIELDAVENHLDDEGMAAVVKALERLNPPEQPSEEPKDVVADAKN